MFKDISKELKAHAPFTMFGALTGIVIIVVIVYAQVPRSTSEHLFHICHPLHVLLSTSASLFHMTMGLGEELTVLMIVLIPIFLFLAVWLPCCTSDIIFPLLFSKAQNSQKPRQTWRSFESHACERIEHEDSHS